MSEQFREIESGIIRRELQRAAYAKEFDSLKGVLKKPSLKRFLTDKDLGLALCSAGSAGDVPIVKLVLDHGAPITMSANAMVSHDKPNTLKILKMFLDYGWSVDSTGGKKLTERTMTMNMLMSREDSEEIIRWFLENGASVDGIASDLFAPIRRVARDAQSLAVVQLFLDHGAALKHTYALHAATQRAGLDEDEITIGMMNLLLDNGIDINELEYEGRGVYRIPWHAQGRDCGTALHVAAQGGHLARAKLLVECGVDVGRLSQKGYTAKDWAQINDYEHVRNYLEGVMRDRGMETKDIEVLSNYRGEENFNQGQMPRR